MQIPTFDEKKFLENLLLDEHREIYNKMAAPEKSFVAQSISVWIYD